MKRRIAVFKVRVRGEWITSIEENEERILSFTTGENFKEWDDFQLRPFLLKLEKGFPEISPYVDITRFYEIEDLNPPQACGENPLL